MSSTISAIPPSLRDEGSVLAPILSDTEAATRTPDLNPVLAVEVVEIDDRSAARHRCQVGEVHRNRHRKIHLLLGPGALRARRAAVEQPAGEARRILEPDAAVALQPRGIFDLLSLGRVVKPNALGIREHEFHLAHRVGGPRLLPRPILA